MRRVKLVSYFNLLWQTNLEQKSLLRKRLLLGLRRRQPQHATAVVVLEANAAAVGVAVLVAVAASVVVAVASAVVGVGQTLTKGLIQKERI
jgi:hypothetical protein